MKWPWSKDEPKIDKPAYINKQPKESLYRHPRSSVEIVNMYLTIQGEGPLTGYPAIFVRLAGCNLDCPLCDTDYTTGRKFYTPQQSVEQCKEIRDKGLVVLTGGEPFRQNITPLAKSLLFGGYAVQVETNGTFHQDGFPYGKVSIVCSPKTQKINDKIPIDYYKYVIQADHVSDIDGLPTSVLGNDQPPARPRAVDRDVPIYIAPCDERDEEKNLANLQAAIKICLEHNYILSEQSHKRWQLP